MIGIGINVGMPAGAAAGIEQAWTDLETACGRRVRRNELAAALLASCFDILAEFRHCGFAHFLEEWARLDALRGRPVSVAAGAGALLQGTADGIDETGALRLLTPRGEQRLSGGEITVRRNA